MSPLLVSLEVAAASIGVNVRQLRRQIKLGQLPAAKPPRTRAYLVDMADVHRLYTPKAIVGVGRRARESERERIRRQLRAAGIAAGEEHRG